MAPKLRTQVDTAKNGKKRITSIIRILYNQRLNIIVATFKLNASVNELWREKIEDTRKHQYYERKPFIFICFR